ncbi:hypothetical protein V6C27_02750 [Peptococcaceae bacterium 1198_IL3148]
MDDLNALAKRIEETKGKLTAKISFINNLLGSKNAKRQIDEALRDLYNIRVELDCLKHDYNNLCIQLNSTVKTA